MNEDAKKFRRKYADVVDIQKTTLSDKRSREWNIHRKFQKINEDAKKVESKKDSER